MGKVPLGPKESKCKCGRTYPYDEDNKLKLCPICTEYRFKMLMTKEVKKLWPDI